MPKEHQHGKDSSESVLRQRTLSYLTFKLLTFRTVEEYIFAVLNHQIHDPLLGEL